MIINCPAKINWMLKIGSKQANGLHELKSHMQKVSLYDEIYFEYDNSQLGNQFYFSISGSEAAGVPVNESNLLILAIQKYFADQNYPKLKITLNKNIPNEAGLGGASSDAGNILRALQEEFNLHSEKKLKKIAAELGSDVPFFLYSDSSAMVSGTGEKILPYKAKKAENILIVKDRQIAISTAWAYREFDKKSANDFAQAKNDFSIIAFEHYPELQIIKNQLIELGAKEVELCGSGSAIFSVFSSATELQKAKNIFDKKKYFLKAVWAL